MKDRNRSHSLDFPLVSFIHCKYHRKFDHSPLTLTFKWNWPWPYDTHLGYSGTVPLYWGTSAINLEYSHFILKCKFIYSELLHGFSCSWSKKKHAKHFMDKNITKLSSIIFIFISRYCDAAFKIFLKIYIYIYDYVI